MIMHFLRICFVLSYFICAESTRRITCFINENLENSDYEKSNTNIVHIISEGKEDTVHFVWCTYKLPSVIVARTTKNTSLIINSTKLISFEKDAIAFVNGKPLESIGVTFSKLWEFHYDKDSVDVRKAQEAKNLDMVTFDWFGVNETLNCTNSYASVAMNGAASNKRLFFKNGTIQIQFSVSGDQELSEDFPRLFFTGNSTLLKFVFNNFYSNYSCARYGFEVSLFSTLIDKCENDKWKEIVTKSINDEISPGVFSDVKLLAPCSDEKHAKSSFLAWRPVAYTGEKPIVANSTDVTITSKILSVPSQKVNVYSIAELYFQNKLNMSFFNVTFGMLGDGCYAATEYTSWTLMIGTGTMVEDSLSPLVIILAGIGIGLLMLFFAVGSFFMLYQRCKERDDDLLLN